MDSVPSSVVPPASSSTSSPPADMPTPPVPPTPSDSLVVPPEPPPAPAEATNQQSFSVSRGGKRIGKKPSVGVILTIIFLLFVTLPLTVMFVGNKNQSTDVRSRAAYALGHTCDPSAGSDGGCGSGEGCSCRNGSCACGLTGGQQPCYHTICPVNYSCNGSGDGSYCSPNTPTSPNNPPSGSTSTPTPTSTTAPSCPAVQVYRNNVLVTDLNTLAVGDTITVVIPGGTATQAQVRLNGGGWNVQTTKDANGNFDITFPILVNAGVTTGTIEYQVYINGTWY